MPGRAYVSEVDQLAATLAGMLQRLASLERSVGREIPVAVRMSRATTNWFGNIRAIRGEHLVMLEGDLPLPSGVVLPAALCPPQDRRFVVAVDGAPGVVTIHSDGTITATGSEVSLSGVLYAPGASS